MIQFFNDDLILGNDTAKFLYEYVGDLPIYDYHCHLPIKDIYDDIAFDNIGELWLKGDHYKWRVMRLSGIDEKYITGDASFKEKFMAFASIMPNLIGNPVYYWAHFELKNIFGITKPLNSENAEYIYDTANSQLKGLTVSKIFKKFNVKFVATTDDPIDSLMYHKNVGDTIVTPTFRPDKAFKLDDDYYQKLSECSGIKIDSANSLVLALENRLDFFISKGAKITDHDLGIIPDFCDDDMAEKIFKNRHNNLKDSEKNMFSGWLLTKIANMCHDKNICMQWHIGALRNVNDNMFNSIGADTGFDVFGQPVDTIKLTQLLNHINNTQKLPKIILYSLNPFGDKILATISGAYRNIRVGTAWWFNDTLEGTRTHLKSVMEYGVLGTHLGMLTDSRSFTSYVRHDFFRRILCDLVGELVEKGEYDEHDAPKLCRDISCENIKEFLNIQ